MHWLVFALIIVTIRINCHHYYRHADNSLRLHTIIKRNGTDSPLFFLWGSPLFRRASVARYCRSARGFEDLIKGDNKVRIYSDAATMFASINDRLPATVRCWWRGAW